MEWLLLSDEQIHTLLAASLRLLEMDDPLQRNGKEAQQRLNEEGPDEGGRNYTPVSVRLCRWILADSDHRAMPCAVPATPALRSQERETITERRTYAH